MARLKNKHISTLCARLGEEEPTRAIARLVAQYRNNAEPLVAVAKNLGVTKIVTEKLPFEGGVFTEGQALIIKLNANSPVTRQKFTLAHELAHLILAPKAAAKARRCVRSSPLESACDAIAAELLMPLAEVSPLSSEKGSVEALLRVSRRFEVSIHAAAVRVKEVCKWPESIGFWKWDKGATELWFVGRRFWPERRVNFNAFQLAMNTSDTVRTDEQHMNYGEGFFTILLEVRRMGREYLLGLVTGAFKDEDVLSEV